MTKKIIRIKYNKNNIYSIEQEKKDSPVLFIKEGNKYIGILCMSELKQLLKEQQEGKKW